MKRDLTDLVGTAWKPEDEWFGDMAFVVVEVRPNRNPDPDVIVLDCQTGKLIAGYYDPGLRPSDPDWEVLICALEKNGKPQGNHYLLPVEYE